jgi:nucleoside-diphosphate-sugar epimerase
MGPALVRDHASALVARSLWFGERVLVLGATGWFGSTMLALLEHHPASVLAVASRSRDHRVGDRTWPVFAYDRDQIVGFAPTLVLDFAYLTRGYEVELGGEEYARRLAELAAQFEDVARLPSVRAVLTVSSGAALAVPEGPSLPVGAYGEGKRGIEALAVSLADPARSVLVARAYSLSGALVGDPLAYAFSDLVLQARTGLVEVRSPGAVWRRYCGVEDYLAVCVADLMDGRSGTVDSGGPLVELRDLAEQIADQYPGPRPTVAYQAPVGAPLTYASDDQAWSRACARHGYAPAALDEQIRAVQAAL